MAHLLVRHSLNPNVVVKFNVTIKQFVTTTSEGDETWLLEVGTGHLDKDGYNLRPKYVHLITLDDLDAEIEKVVSEMCEWIDWGVLIEDKWAPYVYEYSPIGDSVSIDSKVFVKIKDVLPSAGIDLDDMKVFLDIGIDVLDITDDIEIIGDPYEYTLKWSTSLRVFDTYGD